MGLATLYTTTFSAQTNVVDHMNVYQVADPGGGIDEEKIICCVQNILDRTLDMLS